MSMPSREAQKYLYDIAGAADYIAQFTAGRSFEEYRTDPMLRSAVERQFEIIGEALNQLLRREPGLGERISNAPLIIAFRNRLIHGYASVSDEVVWGVVERYLPVLSSEVRALLAGDE
ncbi:DUF86 domain-containing protein [Methanoculleus sp. UBA208]|uniref:HepT-like ribonuclease domain-containing protein n=2 Tax=unclassified Methanoculleus TaxID=2619537 RepID=UPI0025E8F493|nr:HepT-like ribonuclease domain-containing protein [Methanoculleus sp. UBA208]